MSAELLLAAVGIGFLGAAIVLAAVLRDIRGSGKQKAGADSGTEWPKAA
jgi:hypothetical protein